MAWLYDYELTEDGGAALCDFQERRCWKLINDLREMRYGAFNKWQNAEDGTANDYWAEVVQRYDQKLAFYDGERKRWFDRGVSQYNMIPF